MMTSFLASLLNTFLLRTLTCALQNWRKTTVKRKKKHLTKQLWAQGYS
jgi:hypothetical protein